MEANGRSGTHDRVVSGIGASIVSGELQPDDDLDIAELQERFGVSRTAIREALRVLTAKGLVGARPRRGTFVAPRDEWVLLDADVLRWRFAQRIDETFLMELGEVRLTVEPAVARFAAQRRTDRDLADLEDALKAMRNAANDPQLHVESDLDFHTALLHAAHNELFTQMAVVIEVGLRLRDQFVHNALHSETTDKHADVLLAVRARRPKAAETAMRALIERSIEDVDIARKLQSTSASNRPEHRGGLLVEGRTAADRPDGRLPPCAGIRPGPGSSAPSV